MSTKVINSRVVGGLGCGWAKLNVLHKRWFVCQLAALLILRSVGFFVLCFCRFDVELSVVLRLHLTFCVQAIVTLSCACGRVMALARC